MIFLLFTVTSSAAIISTTPNQRIEKIGYENRIEKIDFDDRIEKIGFNNRLVIVSGDK